MPGYDFIDEEYDIVLTKQKGNSKSKNINSKRTKGEKKKDKRAINVYNSKFVRLKVNNNSK